MDLACIDFWGLVRQWAGHSCIHINKTFIHSCFINSQTHTPVYSSNNLSSKGFKRFTPQLYGFNPFPNLNLSLNLSPENELSGYED